MHSKRLAALDIGTNTVVFIVADVRQDGVSVVFESSEITRLGEGSLEDHQLKKEPMARTILAVSDAAQKASELGADWAGAVATSAVREASNGRAFSIMAQAVGAPLQVISGEQEADLAYLSVAFDKTAEQLAVLDIGAGSTELAIGTGLSPSSKLSLPTGAVRLTEQHVRRHPISREVLAALRADARRALERTPIPKGDCTLVGVAGTITTLASVMLALDKHDPARAHGYVMERAALEALIETLARMPLDERMAVPGMEPKRADVIIAGGVIALEAMMQLRADRLVASQRGVHYGLLFSAASEPRGAASKSD